MCTVGTTIGIHAEFETMHDLVDLSLGQRFGAVTE
jgi:hypothetical protein